MTSKQRRWQDRSITSADGIRLHYRDYPGPHERPPILCLPGLTRNARDFEPVGDRFGGAWRVIAVDPRGRGLSGNDPNPVNYALPVYVADLMKLLDQLGIADAVFVGTSQGGLCTMVLAASDSERIAGALINDIGPVIDRAGLDRIGSYVGKDVRFASWDEAAGRLTERNGALAPGWDAAAWMRFARRVCVEEGTEIRFDYDMRIADNFQAALKAEPADLWPYWRALDGRPVTILRGALSDLLTVETAEQMAAELSDAELVTVPAVGHTPSLEEPESLAALDRLLARVLAAG